MWVDYRGPLSTVYNDGETLAEKMIMESNQYRLQRNTIDA
jgi:hypothetical protein